MVGKYVRLFLWMLVALDVSALCIFLIPLIQSGTMLQYGLAGIFWASLLAEVVLLMCCNSLRHRIEKNNPRMKPKDGFGILGPFRFGRNKEAKTVDVMLAMWVVCLAAIWMLNIGSAWVVSCGISGVYLLFQLHCILNGILYKSIKHYHTIMMKRREKK